MLIMRCGAEPSKMRPDGAQEPDHRRDHPQLGRRPGTGPAPAWPPPQPAAEGGPLAPLRGEVRAGDLRGARPLGGDREEPHQRRPAPAAVPLAARGRGEGPAGASRRDAGRLRGPRRTGPAGAGDRSPPRSPPVPERPARRARLPVADPSGTPRGGGRPGALRRRPRDAAGPSVFSGGAGRVSRTPGPRTYGWRPAIAPAGCDPGSGQRGTGTRDEGQGGGRRRRGGGARCGAGA